MNNFNKVLKINILLEQSDLNRMSQIQTQLSRFGILWNGEPNN